MEEQIKSIIQEKITFYGLMKLIFQNEPNAEFAAVLRDMMNEEYFPFMEEGSRLYEIHEELRQTINAKTPDTFARMLRREYYCLFIDPLVIRTSLWHSSYTNSEQLLFQAPNCQAKHFYARYGYVLENDRLPGDHIATEMDFLQKLAEEELRLAKEGKTEEFEKVLRDNVNFIDLLILSWIDKMIGSLTENRSDFYISFASMIKEVVSIDKEIISTILN